jgi:hypothetical protein
MLGLYNGQIGDQAARLLIAQKRKGTAADGPIRRRHDRGRATAHARMAAATGPRHADRLGGHRAPVGGRRVHKGTGAPGDDAEGRMGVLVGGVELQE